MLTAVDPSWLGFDLVLTRTKVEKSNQWTRWPNQNLILTTTFELLTRCEPEPRLTRVDFRWPPLTELTRFDRVKPSWTKPNLTFADWTWILTTPPLSHITVFIISLVIIQQCHHQHHYLSSSSTPLPETSIGRRRKKRNMEKNLKRKKRIGGLPEKTTRTAAAVILAGRRRNPTDDAVLLSLSPISLSLPLVLRFRCRAAIRHH